MIKMKFKAHGSFFIRKGWLAKGLRAVNEDRTIFDPGSIETSMDVLGLGKNMVGSLRYWMNTLELIDEKGRGKDMHAEMTTLGQLVFKNDPYIEEIGTLWILHCVLASNSEKATSWYWFFNEFGMGSFSKEDIVSGIQKYADLRSGSQEGGKKAGAAASSIEADVDCILSTYISHERRSGQQASPENVIDCPLGELGIVGIQDQGRTYKKRQPNLSLLPNMIVLFAIVRAAQLHNEGLLQTAPEVIEISLDELLNGKYYPGRLFNLDSVALLSKLYELENNGFIRINRTAGSDVVRLLDTTITQQDCLAKYYELIG